MYKTGHFGVGLLFLLPLVLVLSFSNMTSVLFVSVALFLFLSIHPDIDIKLSKYTRGAISHRGLTHTILYALIWSVVCFLLYLFSFGVVMSFVGLYVGFVGVISHLVGDFLTPSGVKILYPFREKEYSLGLIKSESIIPNIFILLFGLVCISLTSYILGNLEVIGSAVAISFIFLGLDKIFSRKYWVYRIYNRFN